MTKVRDIMTPGVSALTEVDTVADAAMRMRVSGAGSVPVCDERGRFLGMVTARDVLRIVRSLDSHAREFKARGMMREDVATVQVEDPIEHALAMMALQEITRLPVLAGESLVGVLSQEDVGRSGPVVQVDKLLDIIARAPR